MFSPLAAAYYSNRFALLPVLGLGPIFVIDGNVAVESQSSRGGHTIYKGKIKMQHSAT